MVSNQLVADELEKATPFNGYFEFVFSESFEENLPPYAAFVRKSMPYTIVSQGGVLKLLRNLNVNSVSGPDLIFNHILTKHIGVCL